MKLRLYFIFFVFITILFTSCKPRINIINYNIAGGYVIAKEDCNTNDAEDYWLIDLTYYPNTPQYGDTLTLNGAHYTNVVKVKGLSSRLQRIGMKVALNFKIVTVQRIETTGCNVASPITYKLKELFIIEQGEIR